MWTKCYADALLLPRLVSSASCTVYTYHSTTTSMMSIAQNNRSTMRWRRRRQQWQRQQQHKRQHHGPQRKSMPHKLTIQNYWKQHSMCWTIVSALPSCLPACLSAYCYSDLRARVMWNRLVATSVYIVVNLFAQLTSLAGNGNNNERFINYTIRFTCFWLLRCCSLIVNTFCAQHYLFVIKNKQFSRRMGIG